jgi:hypothetical protein
MLGSPTFWCAKSDVIDCLQLMKTLQVDKGG